MSKSLVKKQLLTEYQSQNNQMSNVTSLNAQVALLTSEKKYDEALGLIDQANLEKHANAELYSRRATIFLEIGRYDEAYEDAQTTLQLDSNYAYAYYIRGYSNLGKQNYHAAILDFDIYLDSEPLNSYGFHARGYCKWKIENLEDAIKDYDKAISLNSKHFDALTDRGMIWASLKEYDKAIENYNQAILVNKNYTHAHNNKGVAYYDKKQFDLALDAFNSAIEIDSNYYRAYLNRAEVWYEKGQFAEANADIQIVFKLDPENKSAKYWRDLIKTKLGETIVTNQNNPEITLYFLFKTVELLPESTQKKINKASADIIRLVDAIRTYTFDIPNGPVVHYTNLKVADIIVSNENSRFRYYNVVYMNDPEEGEILLKCFDNDEITSSFRNGQIKTENNVYVGSFLPDSRKDDLVMWRTYGSGLNNAEAAGCSLVIDTKFFDKDLGYRQPEMRMSMENNSLEMFNPTLEQALSKVIYFDKQKKEFIGDDKSKIAEYVTKLSNALLNLIALKTDKNNKPESDAIDKIIFRSLSELRYLFKSADYHFENELRTIQYVYPQNAEVKIDSSDELPRRLYIESNKDVQPYLNKIILGPKVPNPERWMYLEAEMIKKGFDIQVCASNCRFQ
jgi:tetratricopeptide (TPR) repeat protein